MFSDTVLAGGAPMRRNVFLILLFALAVVSACASGSARELRDREWRMVWVEGDATMPAEAATPTARFDRDGRFSANTGCNSAGAAYVVEGDALTIRPLLMTKRACLDPERNRLERMYVDAIAKTRRFRIANAELELLSEDGSVQARFR
jgi:heat shock protein HslJ